MIDLVNQLNGNGGKDFIPCPSCSELDTIKSIISEYQTFDNEPLSISIDLLLTEVKMWRAKDSYERKLKSTLIASTMKKLKAEGFQLDEPNN